MGLSQRVHSTDIKLRMKLLGEKHSINSPHSTIRPLNEKKAIENAAYLLSEGFIFSIAGSLILFEAYRTRKKELDRRESVSDDIKALQDEINFIKKKLDEHNMELDDYKLPEGLHPLVLNVTDIENPRKIEDSSPNVIIAKSDSSEGNASAQKVEILKENLKEDTKKDIKESDDKPSVKVK